MSANTTEQMWQDTPDVLAVQRRTLRVLSASQIVGGVGVGAAASLGSLLAEAVTKSEGMAGLARTSSTFGAALFGLPLALLALKRGRRSALSLGWTLAASGAGVLVLAAVTNNVVLLVLGMLMFGSGNATNLQSRYAAADMASPMHRARSLSVVIWSTTVGAAAGPNLASPGASVSHVLKLPELAGGFVISGIALVIASSILWITLRPDPLLETAKHEAIAARKAGRAKAEKVAMREVFKLIARTPNARFAFVAVVMGHTVMGSVMTMTPVAMNSMGDSLTVVGFVISVHVLGMYAFSPVVGWLSDRYGRFNMIMVGQVVFVGSALFAGLSSSTLMIATGLFLLGLGWSLVLVAGSAMLGDSVDANIRPAVQGTADTAMNVVSAIAAGISGVVLFTFGFSGLNIVAGLLLLPVLLLAPFVRRNNTNTLVSVR